MTPTASWCWTGCARAQAEGRLDLDEFDERITATLAARTYGELAVITEDLPG